MRTMLFFLLLCACLFAATEVEIASSYNLALAPSLLGAANACGAPSSAPTAGDIFSVADARIVSLIPQAGNTTSDLSSVSALWSWSADFPQTARFSTRQDPRCPSGEIRYFAPSSPSLSGVLSYSYGNVTDAIPISSSGPNPVPLNLSPSKLAGSDFSQPFAPLPVSLSTAISVSYSFSESDYSYQCTPQGGYVGCGCEMEYAHGTRTFLREVFHQMNFSVEVGPDSLLWLNPPLSSRLAGDEKGKVAFFARRLPALISLVSNGEAIANASPYSFSVGTGECGEKIAAREFSPPAGTGIFINTSAPLFPLQLVEKNASYYPFYLMFPWRAEAGKANFTVFFEDAFSHRQAFSREFFVRQPAPFFPSAGAADGSSGAMEQRKASEGETAAAYPAREQIGAFPDFSVLAVAFALPLSIGAAALCRKMEWL